VPSIVDIYPGADWAEREAREYYAVTFEGRVSTPPLMLREGDAVGILLGPEGRSQ
jgi:NADH:ubiquinone oxidoreductase subunit C